METYICQVKNNDWIIRSFAIEEHKERFQLVDGVLWVLAPETLMLLSAQSESF